MQQLKVYKLLIAVHPTEQFFPSVQLSTARWGMERNVCLPTIEVAYIGAR